ncbi:uncharacterized protein LOC135492631 [Lineus longissimus]|uniref:uncharacterized protein LOC135492631 n=1 Tax=Lineus longissimus TaxID=88925 RepID=UPI002B4D34C8
MARSRIKWSTFVSLVLACLTSTEGKDSKTKCPKQYCGPGYRCVVKEDVRFCVRGTGKLADDIEEKCEDLDCELPKRCYVDLPICVGSAPCGKARVVCRSKGHPAEKETGETKPELKMTSPTLKPYRKGRAVVKKVLAKLKIKSMAAKFKKARTSAKLKKKQAVKLEIKKMAKEGVKDTKTKGKLSVKKSLEKDTKKGKDKTKKGSEKKLKTISGKKKALKSTLKKLKKDKSIRKVMSKMVKRLEKEERKLKKKAAKAGKKGKDGKRKEVTKGEVGKKAKTNKKGKKNEGKTDKDGKKDNKGMDKDGKRDEKKKNDGKEKEGKKEAKPAKKGSKDKKGKKALTKIMKKAQKKSLKKIKKAIKIKKAEIAEKLMDDIDKTKTKIAVMKTKGKTSTKSKKSKRFKTSERLNKSKRSMKGKGKKVPDDEDDDEDDDEEEGEDEDDDDDGIRTGVGKSGSKTKKKGPRKTPEAENENKGKQGDENATTNILHKHGVLTVKLKRATGGKHVVSRVMVMHMLNALGGLHVQLVRGKKGQEKGVSGGNAVKGIQTKARKAVKKLKKGAGKRKDKGLKKMGLESKKGSEAGKGGEATKRKSNRKGTSMEKGKRGQQWKTWSKKDHPRGGRNRGKIGPGGSRRSEGTSGNRRRGSADMGLVISNVPTRGPRVPPHGRTRRPGKTKMSRHPPPVRDRHVLHSYRPPDWMPDLQAEDIPDPCEAKRCRHMEECHVIRMRCKREPCEEKAVCIDANPCKGFRCRRGQTCSAHRQRCQFPPCPLRPVCEQAVPKKLCQLKKCGKGLICKTKRPKKCKRHPCRRIAYCAQPKTCAEMTCPAQEMCRMTSVVCFALPCQLSGPECIKREKSLPWRTLPIP